jgi:hypothetical protein
MWQIASRPSQTTSAGLNIRHHPELSGIIRNTVMLKAVLSFGLPGLLICLTKHYKFLHFSFFVVSLFRKL